ncbi:hypothetical protein M422DRAFT_272103 [Sphaerobolus stellatus SS14]|uniref:Uncharacterized protein n=1 Tax=Sphaerobolus stellatus (strain SS14) TaxID=990650 RepID=A0A0C9UN84_SPHS4|nr:hypothetical protein M422DRAFT_272103 [Sphaerobolus stellatus SS14]
MDINRTTKHTDNPLPKHTLTAIQDINNAVQNGINSAMLIHTPQTTTSSPHSKKMELRLTPNAHMENRQHSLDRMTKNDSAMDVDKSHHLKRIMNTLLECCEKCMDHRTVFLSHKTHDERSA